jgi:hypothetical protein
MANGTKKRAHEEYEKAAKLYNDAVSRASNARKFNPDNNPNIRSTGDLSSGQLKGREPALPNPNNQNKNQNQNHIPEQDPKTEAEPVKTCAPSARFQKPSLEEIKLQASKIGLIDSEAEKFFNYYESNGWRVGRNPMKSWVSALANWKKNWHSGVFQPTRAREVKPDYTKGKF